MFPLCRIQAHRLVLQHPFSHHIVLKGELLIFEMLIELGTVPYLDKIGEISYMQGTASMEFKMKVWIALK